MDTVTATPAARRVELAEHRLREARAALVTVTGKRDALDARAAERHWTENDTAIGSGVRRKPNPKADARRYAGYARQSDVYVRFDELTAEVEQLERALAAALADRDRVTLTRADVVGARAVRDRFGWHKVARVNKTTVSVETGYSWTDRIDFGRILEARA